MLTSEEDPDGTGDPFATKRPITPPEEHPRLKLAMNATSGAVSVKMKTIEKTARFTLEITAPDEPSYRDSALQSALTLLQFSGTVPCRNAHNRDTPYLKVERTDGAIGGTKYVVEEASYGGFPWFYTLGCSQEDQAAAHRAAIVLNFTSGITNREMNEMGSMINFRDCFDYMKNAFFKLLTQQSTVEDARCGWEEMNHLWGEFVPPLPTEGQVERDFKQERKENA